MNNTENISLEKLTESLQRCDLDMPLSKFVKLNLSIFNEYKKFVHILNDFSLNLLMKELDTAPDFINYLTRKEDLFQNVDIIALGEEDMLAQYLSTTDDKGIHDFFNKDSFNASTEPLESALIIHFNSFNCWSSNS